MSEELPPDIRTRIAEATKELAAAQDELTTTLVDLAAKERADKMMISAVLRTVLDKVSAAKRKLAAIIADDPDDLDDLDDPDDPDDLDDPDDPDDPGDLDDS